MGPTFLVLLVAGSACIVRYRGTDVQAAQTAYDDAVAEHTAEGFHPACSVIRSTIQSETPLAPPIRRYTTENGSQYEICANKIRRVTRGPKSTSERFLRDWRDAEAISAEGVGFPIIVTWGTGRDEHSPADAPDDATNTRATVSSRVVNMEIVTP